MKFNLNTFFGRVGATLWALFPEHAIVNVFRENFHPLSPRAFRSSQPTPAQIKRRVEKYGIKTVVNCRGFAKDSPLRELEEEACEKAGVKLVHFKIFSRKVPKPEDVRKAKELFDSIKYPVMFHCKSGSDRVGLMSTLFLHLKEGQPVEEIDQLKFWPYGHLKGARTGILDHFLECFTTYHKEHPEADLLQWAETAMDREQVKASFKLNPFTNFLVDKVLHRE